MGDMTRDFSRKEFSCKCGCGFDAIKPELVQTVQVIRDAAGAPVFINSGCRCPEHNKAVGGVPNSSHMSGYAADIYISGWGNIRLGGLIKRFYYDGKLPYLKYCYRIGGTTRTAVHLDVDNTKKRYRTFGF